MQIVESITGVVLAAFAVWLVVRITNRSTRRLVFVATATVTVTGTSCAFLVMLGKWCEWPGFSVRSGYWGTYFLDDLLYSMGNSDDAVKVVAVVWFIYGAGIGGGAAAIGLKMFNRDRPLHSSDSRPEEVALETLPEAVNRRAPYPDSRAQ
jgi:hypothetical protein